MNIQLFIGSLTFMFMIPKNLAEPDDVVFVAEFIDQIRNCDGFENTMIKCQLTVGYVEGKMEGEGGLDMSGLLEVLTDIENSHSIRLQIWKETDLAKEFMYTVEGNICNSLGKEDTPWWPLAKIFNSSECPIGQAVYPVNNVVLSLDFAKDVLRHEFVGDYEVELSIVDDLEQRLACYVIGVGISEKLK